jgi:SAM-dependent methyltransferase
VAAGTLAVVAIDPAAASGFSQGAEAYARGRPGYAGEAIDWLLAELALTRGARVLDLAAGTGKLTAQLVDRGLDVIAVEPIEEMRAQLRRALPAVEALDGTAESLPLPDAAVAATFVGEAFHWFDAAIAIAEIARVVQPGGGVALLWNRPELTDVPWGPRWGAIIGPHFQATSASSRWLSREQVRDVFGAPGPFDELASRHFDNVHEVDREGFVAQTASMSFIANLPEVERTDALRRIAALADDIAGEDGSIAMRYRTEAYRARRA